MRNEYPTAASADSVKTVGGISRQLGHERTCVTRVLGKHGVEYHGTRIALLNSMQQFDVPRRVIEESQAQNDVELLAQNRRTFEHIGYAERIAMRRYPK